MQCAQKCLTGSKVRPGLSSLVTQKVYFPVYLDKLFLNLHLNI